MKAPVHTCLGCRRARPKSSLVRLVCDGAGTVRMDPEARAVGRGAYVCPDPACVDRAVKGSRLAHAFRRPCRPRADLAAAVGAAGSRDGSESMLGSVRRR